VYIVVSASARKTYLHKTVICDQTAQSTRSPAYAEKNQHSHIILLQDTHHYTNTHAHSQKIPQISGQFFKMQTQKVINHSTVSYYSAWVEQHRSKFRY